MGTLIKGINGHISGKVGNVVGSSWRGINYVKSLPKTSLKPKSEKQLAQQAKFALAVRFMHPVKDLLNIGFRQQHRPATGYNLAIKHTLTQAIIGQYPNYAIDYSKVQYSNGPLRRSEGVKLIGGTGCLVIIWHGDGFRFNSFGDDQVHILIYEPDTNTYLQGPEGVQRMQEAAIIAIPEQFKGKILHTFLFCVSWNGQVSDTAYAGETIIR
ncbi:MAG: hypothetical protein B7X86_07525 [Sphingobacteriales bacterium 17-39-43]|uniref:DUF6266 family protein n=1 Tax=Daejeonella sp. TaxID=2805397 RepID=UPI000BC56870|nr:DUF6266 family protein [Daejeonella sp.]OYY02224.1 MAG: hypothetical protein B7Y76_05960 [Sphingobacteriia bacterium 35-40-5]OYZ31788.1 MAG: hypothetical protein B7Y24_08100 [Sphingobacteriales bacterium 16-39-50]OYZ53530.1 MAG: hypothetical protein B7Y19_05455 [Sphingobacteriales bacterium 24-40-4]OZA24887.1 MAG: hypothetical protein B7X86_07525 [Sphingobacteriales bacterium 17-39-43]HQS06276.1 DUF6266 family protein [Daejeonella sp.]